MVEISTGDEKKDIEALRVGDGKFIFKWTRTDAKSNKETNYLVLTGADGAFEHDGSIPDGLGYNNPSYWSDTDSKSYTIKNFKGILTIFKLLVIARFQESFNLPLKYVLNIYTIDQVYRAIK